VAYGRDIRLGDWKSGQLGQTQHKILANPANPANPADPANRVKIRAHGVEIRAR
jgi:hypothetical protein